MEPPAFRTFPQIRSHRLAGMGYGQVQSTLLLHAEVDPAASPRLEAFDAFMAGRMEEPLPAGEGQSQAPSGVLALALRLRHAYGALQRQQKIPAFGPGLVVSVTSRAEGRALVLFALPCHEAKASHDVLDLVMSAIDTLAAPEPADPAEVEQLASRFDACVTELRRHSLDGINSFHFLRTAHAMGIPATRWLPDVYAFGLGANQRLLQRSLTEETPALGANVARRKSATAQVLRRAGVPVPRHQPAQTAEDAVRIAGTLGYPVVVKPDDMEQGVGVSAGLRTEAAVVAAFHAASRHSKNILVEKHHAGEDYRLTVYQGEVVKILHRRPCGVVGDGQHTIRELVAKEQRTPRFQGVLLREGKMLIELDEEALGLLADQSLAELDVPPAGRFVALRRKANVSAGGTQTLVPLDRCHPDNAAMVVRACASLRLDLCGVDLIVPDLSQSWFETGAVILELNAQPQIGWNLAPEVYAHILTRLLRDRWSIPLRLAICASGAEPHTLDEASAIFGSFDANGFSAPGQAWIDGALVTREPPEGFAAAGVLLGDTRVRAAGMVMTIEELSRTGLPAARFERILFLVPAGLDAAQAHRWTWAEALVRQNTDAIEQVPVRQKVIA